MKGKFSATILLMRIWLEDGCCENVCAIKVGAAFSTELLRIQLQKGDMRESTYETRCAEFELIA